MTPSSLGMDVLGSRRGLVALAGLLLAVPLAQASPAQPASASAAPVWVWSDPGHNGDAGALLAGLDRLGLPSHHLDRLGMVTFRADAATARALRDLAGGRLDEDRGLDLHLDRSVPYVGADAVKRSVGVQRAGPTVLVVDTGIDSSHPDFAQGQNLAANVQTVRVDGLAVGSREDAPVVDQAGHGTHVAGIVGGSGASLGDSDELHGRYTGVYSVGRIASFQASSSEADRAAKVEVVAALEGFEWALDNQERLDIRVVTNSWGEEGGFDPAGPIATATQRLYLAGMVVVFSAGNTGEDGPGTLNRYCVAPWVLCVAAGDLEGARQPFSSMGSGDPGKPYDHPDLTAPGLSVTSARPAGRTAPEPGALDLLGTAQHPSAQLYVDRSGTSIAAPHVAGAAALLLAANPELSPDQVMDTLVTTARPMPGEPVSAVGAGYLDVRAAYDEARALTGERTAFLAGEAVHYSGAASGDAQNANDPVAVGVQGQEPVSGLLAAPVERLFVATPVGIVLLVLALAAVVVGTRSRLA